MGRRERKIEERKELMVWAAENKMALDLPHTLVTLIAACRANDELIRKGSRMRIRIEDAMLERETRNG